MKKPYFLFALALVPSVAHAHCPLCTAGAGVLAMLAISLGVPALIISTLLGGFALAMGLWLAKLPKKEYVRHQYYLISGLVYLSTVLPLWPVLREYKTLYAPYIGFDKYANKIPVDVYIVGVILGATALIIAPYISSRVSAQAKRQLVPFQGIIITMILLVAVPLIIDALFLI